MSNHRRPFGFLPHPRTRTGKQISNELEALAVMIAGIIAFCILCAGGTIGLGLIMLLVAG